MNDLQYLQGDKKRTKIGEARTKKPNVLPRASETVSREVLRKQRLLKAIALSNPNARERLTLDHEQNFIA